MREILFSGKTDNGKWVEGCLISAKDYCCILQDEEKVHPTLYPCLSQFTGCIDGYATPVIPETVGQYTGLTDKNGKKIFEGDIVKGRHWTSYTNKNPEEYHLWLVDWSERSGLITFTCSPTSSAILSIHDFADLSEIEVIGNIHDNPELLKGGEQK